MNKTYRTVWCESTGTFVAVAENVKARGKRSTGARLLARSALAVVMATGAVGTALADVTIDDSTNPASWDGSEIIFSDGTGRIVFNNGGTVTGLNDAALAAGSTDAVAGRQLFQTNERVGAAETAITAAQNNITTLQGDVSTAQNNITTLQGDVSTAQNNITTLQSDVGTAQSDITALQGQVGDMGTSIATGSVTADSLNVADGALVVDSSGIVAGTDVDMGGNKITNLGEGVIAAGSTDAVTGSQINSLLIDQGASGIRYFHANSIAADSNAVGAESVAIGPRTTAEGVSSLAAGDGAATTETAEGAIALGQGATAGPTVAATDDAGAGAIAIGRQSVAGTNEAVALGDGATAVAANASALGAGASAAGTRSIAVGTAAAMGSGSIAAGSGATSATNDSIALGTAAGQGTGTEINDPGQRHSFIAIGKNAGQNMDGNEAIAIGVSAGSNTSNSQQIAIGTEAGTYLNGERNVSLGYQANNYGGEQSIRHATAIGGLSKAATDGVGVGYAAEAASGAVAVGAGAIANAGSIALGQNSHATDVTGASYLTGLAYNGPSVSVGNADTGLTRRITNVADGSADNDAVNVNQLRELKDSLGSFDPQSGGNVNYNSDGTISVTAGTADNSAVNLAQMNTAIAQGKPQYYSINPNGDTNNIDGSGALGADSANSMAIGHAARIDSAENATAVGYSVLVKADNGTALGSGSTVDNTSGVAIGNAAYSRGENSLAMGTDAQTEQQGVGRTSDNAIAIGTSSRATEDSASALGHYATASGLRSSAVGYMANAEGINSMAFGTESDALATDSQASGTNATASGVSAQASGTRALASGADAIASGTDSVGYADSGIAMGTGAVSGFHAVTPEEVARNRNSIAVGTSALANNLNAMAVGNDANATGESAAAFGDGAIASGLRSTAIGYQAQVDVTTDSNGDEGADGIAIGSFAHSSGPKAGAIGPLAKSSGNGSYAIGYMANAASDNGIAIGVSSEVTGQSAIAVGMRANASGGSATSVGVESVASGDSSAAIGRMAKATGPAALAAGYNAQASAISSTAVGYESTASGTEGLALGARNTAGGSQSVAIGSDSGAMANSAIAMGDSASVALGANNAIALGTNATASQQGAVALGSGASTAAAVGTSSITVDKKTYGFAGTSPVATVSVGSQGAERTVTNVAAGRISATSTDAINGSQLYGTNMALNSLGNDLDTVGQSVTNALGGNAAYDPVTHQVTINNVGGTGENTVDGAIAYAAQGWDVSANAAATGDAGANVAPGGSVDFANIDGNIDITRTGTDLAFNLAQNIDLTEDGSVTTGDSVMNNDGLTVDDGAGNVTTTTTAGTTVTNAAGATSTVGAGTVSVTDVAGNQTTIGGNQVAVGGSNPVVISGDTGTIGGLTNKTFDPDNFTSGQAATEDQLKLVSDVANAGWTATDVAGNSANIGPNGVVTFEGDSNISVAQTGVDQNGVVAVSLNENIDLGATGSVITGNTVMNNDGVAVDDGAGNVTTTTTAGTTVTNAAGATSTIGAGTVSVADAAGNQSTIGGTQVAVGGSNPIVISGDTGTIGGLTNTTFDPDNFTSGQAATEDQLKLVSDVANAGWTATDATGNSANIGPNGVVTFEGDDNISVAQTGVDQNGVVAVSLNENIDLGATGSVTTGNTLVNNDGVAIDDGAGNTTEVGAGTISVTDPNGTTTIAGNQVAVGGSNPIVISGDTGTIGGLTNTTFDPDNFTSGQAATEDQLKLVSDVANAGWTATDAAGNSANIGPNGVVTFEGDDNISVAQTGVDQNGVVAVSLNENIDLGTAGSVTTGDSVMNNDGLTVDDGAGNATQVGAGSISVADANGTTTIGGNQIAVGGTSPIVISGDTGTIGGLTNTTFDPDNFTSGQAATEDQLKLVSDVANAGWNVTDATGNSANIGPNGVVAFEGDSNISVAQTGVDQNGVIAVSLNENIDLGATGSVTTGNTVMNNDGLTVNDGAGNVTTTNATGTRVADGAGNSATTTAAGTIVSNAAGDTTTLGAGVISVADAGGTTAIGGNQIVVGGASPITLNGAAGTIEGLTNKTVEYPEFADGSGRAATEEQLKQVNDVANTGWNVTDAAGNSANIGPNGVVTFEGDDNISVAQTGEDQDGVIAVSLNENIDLGATGSVTTGNTVMNNDGLAVNNGAGNSTVVGAGSIAVTDSDGTTAIDGNEILIGGLSPIVISGSTGTIEGLTNTTVNYPGFGTAGRAATEEQLKPVTDFIGLNDDGKFNYNGEQYASLQDALDSMHWNVEAPAPDNSGDGSGDTGSNGGNDGSSGNGSDNGSSDGNTSTPIHNGNTVGFVEGDNIVISKTERPDGSGADVKVSVAKDINVNSVTAKTVNAQEVKIENGPTINQNGIDMNGKKISNVAAGTDSSDAVNLGQLEAATSGLQNQVNQVRGDLSRLDNKLSAGIAAAMATAGLPQAYLPGKSMMSMAGGTYNGESGFAIGVSTVSDNGSWVLKLSGNSNSRGDYGGAVGVGYQW